jgi:thiol-disulfide isomerase/thioredoxin
MEGFRPSARPTLVDQKTFMVRNSLFTLVAFELILTMTVFVVDTGSLAVSLHSSYLYAQVDWFPSPSQKLTKPQSRRRSVASKARVLFFISPECRFCPQEAAKLEAELKRLGWEYEVEGIFVGDPPQVGKYLAGLRTYPFNFELELDMDGSIAKQYGVNTFPTAVIEVDGKRVVVTRASELSEKLR